jgi:hypothetical protein
MNNNIAQVVTTGSGPWTVFHFLQRDLDAGVLRVARGPRAIVAGGLLPKNWSRWYESL